MNRFRPNKCLSISLLLAVLFSSPGDNLFRFKSRQTSINYSNSIELINEVNSLRISNGLPAYQINQTLMLIAQNHSDYQASISSITHYGPDGSRPFQRALAAGYPVAGDLSLGGYFSENIVAGRGLSASDAVNSWKSDAPHLNTMLSTTLQDIGAGVTVVGDTIYYTIDVGLSTSGTIIKTQEVGVVPTYNLFAGRKILTSTPGLDGSIYHIVDYGDTIWSISQAYKIPEEELVVLNSLSDNFIYVGDKFLIRPAYTPTSTSPSSTPTRIASLTPSYTPSTKTTSTNSLSTSTIPDISYSSGENDKFLIGIIAITLIISIFAAYMGKTNTGK